MKKWRYKLWIATRRLQLEIAESTYNSIPYLASGVAAAVVCSGYTYLFRGAEALCMSLLKQNIYYVFLLVPLAFVGSWLMVHLFAPGAAGSGIPQVLASLDEKSEQKVFLQNLLSIRVIVVKILSSSLMVLGGAAVGREGPSIQISAALFYKFRGMWNSLGNKLSLKNMLVAGGAGGIAAAFNTPLGGIIYAVEELARDHVSNFRIGLLEAVITAGLIAQLINGPYLFLGFPILPLFKLKALPVVILVAAVCGLAGAAFGRLTFWGFKIRKEMNFKTSFLFVLFLSLTVALLILLVGLDVTNSGKYVVTDILFKDKHVTFDVVLGRFFGPFFAALTGAAGGIFAPALAAGATLGEWIAHTVSGDLNNLAPVCGMIGFLTGLTRTPVTAFVLMLEMTDRHSAIFPMMLSALVAHILAQVVDNKSFYERMSRDILDQHKSAEGTQPIV